MNLADEDKIEEEFDDSIQGKYDHNKKVYNPKTYINSPFIPPEAEIHIE